jgi:hypothetical protein
MKNNATNSANVDTFTAGLFFDSSLPIISFLLLILLIA